MNQIKVNKFIEKNAIFLYPFYLNYPRVNNKCFIQMQCVFQDKLYNKKMSKIYYNLNKIIKTKTKTTNYKKKLQNKI